MSLLSAWGDCVCTCAFVLVVMGCIGGSAEHAYVAHTYIEPYIVLMKTLIYCLVGCNVHKCVEGSICC